jgi:hypothetical protein
MYETLKRLYQTGSIDQARLDKAVILGWITSEQKQEIIVQ